MPCIAHQIPSRTDESLFLRIALQEKKPVSPAPDYEDSQLADEEPPLRCARCSTVVTHQRFAIRMQERHEHVFFNPAGITFEVHCFQKAPGAMPHGNPTTEFTWFPGFRWQPALCRTCQSHLGWLFSNGGSFFGLIKTRLL